MKDAFEFFKADTFRLLVIYVLPGGLLVWPYYHLLLINNAQILSILPTDTIARATTLIAFSIVVGLVFETISARIEVLFFDSTDMDEFWYGYLLCEISDGRAIRSVISQMVMRMKSEMNITLSLLLSIPAVFMFPSHYLPLWMRVVLTCGMLLISGYLFWEAKQQHRELHVLREKICTLIP